MLFTLKNGELVEVAKTSVFYNPEEVCNIAKLQTYAPSTGASVGGQFEAFV